MEARREVSHIRPPPQFLLAQSLLAQADSRKRKDNKIVAVWSDEDFLSGKAGEGADLFLPSQALLHKPKGTGQVQPTVVEKIQSTTYSF